MRACEKCGAPGAVMHYPGGYLCAGGCKPLPFEPPLEPQPVQAEGPKPFLRDITTAWEWSKEDNEVACHSRIIGGVLCRWWGDGNPPSGVAQLDVAFPQPGSPSGVDAATKEVVSWAQAVLTGLNVGDVKSGSPLHLKLREVMIAYRAANAPDNEGEP